MTLFGESAGALSIGLNLIAKNGSDDGLFHGAIMESGSPFFAHSFPTLSDQTKALDTVLNQLNCTSPRDAIDCLRRIPAQELASAAARVFWRPVIDYDLFSQLPSESLNQGYFIKVPILIGTNTNEGTLFLDAYRAGKPVNTREDLWMVMQANMTPFVLSNNTIDLSYQIYSELKNMSEAQLGTVVEDPGPEYGQLFGQASLILGDSMFNAGRRATCQAWTKNGVPAYSYRFDTDPAGVDPRVYGSAHFQEVAFVFANIGGKGYDTNPFHVNNTGLRTKYVNLSHIMAKMWINFAQTGSPNNHKGIIIPFPWSHRLSDDAN